MLGTCRSKRWFTTAENPHWIDSEMDRWMENSWSLLDYDLEQTRELVVWNLVDCIRSPNVFAITNKSFSWITHLYPNIEPNRPMLDNRDRRRVPGICNKQHRNARSWNSRVRRSRRPQSPVYAAPGTMKSITSRSHGICSHLEKTLWEKYANKMIRFERPSPN